MEYRHNPPSLSDLRKMRKEIDARRKISSLPNSPKKGMFAKTKPQEVSSDEDYIDEVEINRYEHDMILAHLENQNELLLELVRKIDRK